MAACAERSMSFSSLPGVSARPIVLCSRAGGF